MYLPGYPKESAMPLSYIIFIFFCSFLLITTSNVKVYVLFQEIFTRLYLKFQLKCMHAIFWRVLNTGFLSYEHLWILNKYCQILWNTGSYFLFLPLNLFQVSSPNNLIQKVLKTVIFCKLFCNRSFTIFSIEINSNELYNCNFF